MSGPNTHEKVFKLCVVSPKGVTRFDQRSRSAEKQKVLKIIYEIVCFKTKLTSKTVMKTDDWRVFGFSRFKTRIIRGKKIEIHFFYFSLIIWERPKCCE